MARGHPLGSGLRYCHDFRRLCFGAGGGGAAGVLMASKYQATEPRSTVTASVEEHVERTLRGEWHGSDPLHSWNFGLAVSYLEGEPESNSLRKIQNSRRPAVEWRHLYIIGALAREVVPLYRTLRGPLYHLERRRK